MRFKGGPAILVIAAVAAGQNATDGEKLIQASDCSSCHAVDREVVGPAYNAIVLPGQGQKVTKEVFHGYQLYNSYCYRCHGTDANGGQLGPDLRHSLAAGMKPREFLAVAMSGRKEKAMPAWAGFLSEDDVFHVYRYVKGRSLGLVQSGRPPSEQD
jgi:cytochrome c